MSYQNIENNAQSLLLCLGKMKSLLDAVPDECEHGESAPIITAAMYKGIKEVGQEFYNAWTDYPVEGDTGLDWKVQDLTANLREITAMGASMDWEKMRFFEPVFSFALLTMVELIEKAIAAAEPEVCHV